MEDFTKRDVEIDLSNVIYILNIHLFLEINKLQHFR